MPTYSTTQLAEKAGCHRASIHNMIKQYESKGGIPGAKKLGHIWVFNEKSEQFIKKLIGKANRKKRT